MLQEMAKSPKNSALGDFLIMIAIIAAIVFMRYIANLISLLPYAGLFHVVLLLSAAAACFLIYKTRILSYRYTLITQEEPDEEARGEHGEENGLDMPPGTVIFERMTGDKTNTAQAIAPNDIQGLFGPGGAPCEKPQKSAMMTALARKTAHSITFINNGRLERIYFHPSDAFVEKLRESMQK